MIRFWAIAAICALMAGCLNSEARSTDPARDIPAIGTQTAEGWTLVWSDEFNDQSLDRTKWEPEQSCWGGGNQERQCYTDRADNVWLSGERLILRAQKETFGGLEFPQDWPDRGKIVEKSYTSGKVRSKGLASFTYGRFEARIKLPQGQSTWPAFWMLPEDDSYGGWPLSGEIDIMEAVNLGATCPECDGHIGENRTLGALHFGKPWPDNQFRTASRTLTLDENSREDFHIYAVEWQKGRIDWYVNGERFYTLTEKDWFTGAVDKSDNPYAPFDQPFYLMFNLAVGGHLPDQRNEKAFNPDSFPAQMEVDWVRVYQRDDEKSGAVNP